jgi:Holliday junction DNA helicase RuvA
MTPVELAGVIARGDTAALRRLKGVGAKLAERLAVELRDKVVAPSLTATAGDAVGAPMTPAGDGRHEQVVRALVGLGYRAAQAERAAAAAAHRMPDAQVAALLREALKSVDIG